MSKVRSAQDRLRNAANPGMVDKLMLSPEARKVRVENARQNLRAAGSAVRNTPSAASQVVQGARDLISRVAAKPEIGKVVNSAQSTASKIVGNPNVTKGVQNAKGLASRAVSGIKNIASGFLKKAGVQKQVAAVGVICDSKFLMGKRKDNGKWTQPGGHMEEGETPMEGAIRELKEETGIVAKESDLKSIGSKIVADGKIKVHGFIMDCKDKPKSSMLQDPDEEVYRWLWKPMELPQDVKENLHVPKGNIIFDHLKIEY